MKTYAAYYDNVVRKESSSGGMFSALASLFDVIYGVEMDAQNKFAVYARKTDDISSLRGSKYLQARVGDTFKKVRKDVEDGRQVLFSGTACQVNGLYSFLQRDYANLFTVDVICHGVPTPKYWQKFIEGKEIEHINFRAKDGGWDHYTYGMRLNDDYIPFNKNHFMELYVKDYALRPSCYECVCKQVKCSDMTLGDFWGIENLDPTMTDNKGTNIVIVRSQRGLEIFEELKKNLVWKAFSYEDGIRQNPSEYKSAVRPENRIQFFKDLETDNFTELFRKYCAKNKSGDLIAHKIRRIIKRIGGVQE